jgi:hypothetical protein
MEPLPDRYAVRKFVEGLEAGARVIWIATGEKGTVQPDKSILWDDGSRMTTDQMTSSHSVLIHREPEWLRMHDALATMLDCVKSGCGLERWADGDCTKKLPQELCPLPALSQASEPPVVARTRPTADSLPLDTPKRRHRAHTRATS